MTVFRCIWRNVSNLRYVYTRPLPYSALKVKLDSDLALVDAKRAITNHILAEAGLMVVDDDKDMVPRWLALTPRQESLRKLVSPYFKVGLHATANQPTRS